MDKITLNSLNSQYITFDQDSSGNLVATIKMSDILEGKVRITTADVLDSSIDRGESKKSSNSTVIITDSIRTTYITHNLGDKDILFNDVYHYLETVAQCWESSNKSASAVTGSLIGKVSKQFTELNEKLFKYLGSEGRDTLLKELIKSNMPLLKELWGLNK